ncbi:2-iminoacetate synthase ThiH [Aliidiomarina sp. Khilg15.8]
MSFVSDWEGIPWANWQLTYETATVAEVDRVLRHAADATAAPLTTEELAVLLSPAAKSKLEPMARQAMRLTRQRFGNTMRMFVPLYLSNLCANDCSYCGFSMSNAIRRKTLNMAELATECEAIQALGFDSILLVAGEHERKVGTDYFLQAMAVVKRYFTHISLEVQPLTQADYAKLRRAGLAAVYVYQETYQEKAYTKHHLRGRKTDMQWRLQTAERVIDAGVDKLGLGVLLGLANWRLDAVACAMHLRYLQRYGWRTRYSMAFPRLRPCEGGVEIEDMVSDADLVQLICAFRLFEPDLEITLSTRESVFLRDHLMQLGITHMSAGSKTQPGGYADESIALEQFSTNDNRSPQRVAQALSDQGLEPVWKDWQTEFC